MTKIQKIKIVFVACVLSLVAIPAFAAEVSFNAKAQEIKAGQLFEVGVFINTDNEEINAIEGKIIFPQNLLEIKKINDGNSIINFWIEKPKSASDGQIAFSGIVPGGYTGNQGLIFSIIFQSIQEGQGSTEIRDIKALLNDGKGREAKTTIFNFQFSISKEMPGFEFQVPGFKDTESPEEFKPEIASDSNIFDGKYFLVFATQDKGSGIDYYAIHETTRKKEITPKESKLPTGQARIDTKKWIGAESPYVLKDQKLRSYIYVKSVDKAGNERVAVIEPRYPIKWYEQPLVWVIIVIIGIIVYLIWRKFKNK